MSRGKAVLCYQPFETELLILIRFLGLVSQLSLERGRVAKRFLDEPEETGRDRAVNTPRELTGVC